jgi:metal-responsive CopG/Arc/MetJ family transcriptional regulator
MAKKGRKSTRGRPEIYSEVKTTVCLALTPTAISKLDELAKSMRLSRSEFVEQIARGLIDIASIMSKETVGL